MSNFFLGFLAGFLSGILILSLLRASTDYFERLLIVREYFYKFIKNEIDLVSLKKIIDDSVN